MSLCNLLSYIHVCVSQQVRETETWMPMKTTQTVGMLTHPEDLVSSGDSQNGSDFGFTDDEDDEDDDDYDTDDTLYDDEDEYDEFSGSGDAGSLFLFINRMQDFQSFMFI